MRRIEKSDQPLMWNPDHNQFSKLLPPDFCKARMWLTQQLGFFEKALVLEMSLGLKHTLKYELLCCLYFELQLDLMDFCFTDQPLKSHQGNVICLFDMCISSTFFFVICQSVNSIMNQSADLLDKSSSFQSSSH